VLSPAELRELASLPGLEIGSHTRNHLFLPAQTRAVKINEISTNLEYLSTLLGKAVRSFAYPYGAFDQETVQICRAIGFRDCVTVVPQTIRPWSDPCLLPRHEVKARGLDEFKSFIDDIFH
jgi:peptidoglycan/xylan/chitin deacetylase (PgdA/CDA1 family)